jgi:1-aminocyclopropane-1-carboxylate deaminase/D-cysteine desulfhydrase-like pyridoxal-dependent ACC family enzyme
VLIKRDDAIAFGFGGNKVRKLAFVAAHGASPGADTLITAGGVQSNHARATASAAAKLGMRAILVAQRSGAGAPAAQRVAGRAAWGRGGVRLRPRRAHADDERDRRSAPRGRGAPYVIPIGASTPLGALGYVHAVAELVDQIEAPDVIVHSTSSGRHAGRNRGRVSGLLG